jgi:DNA-binding response OmpR family regulator
MLPGKNGFELLAEIREDGQFKDTPVIIFSNRDSQEDRRKAKELGAAAFHVKAMTDLAELVTTIENLVK